MEMNFELIFTLITAVSTGLLGAVLKGNVVPSHLIPVQNMVIGIIAAFVAVYFGLFNDVPTAIVVSLFTALGVGGGYDLIKTQSDKEVE